MVDLTQAKLTTFFYKHQIDLSFIKVSQYWCVIRVKWKCRQGWTVWV